METISTKTEISALDTTPNPNDLSNKQLDEKTLPNTEISVSNLLNSNPVRIILTPKNLLVVNAVEKVGTLLQRLRDSDMRCAIVYDTEQLFIGFVDALDITTHVLNVSNWAKDFEESFRDLDWRGQRFVSELSGKLINISNSDAFRTVTPNTPLRDIVELMARGMHRLAVVEDGNIINVVSQWDLLLLSASRMSFMGAKFQKSLIDAGLSGNTQILLSVPEHVIGIDTLKFMWENEVSGVPLVDSVGKISGNFSVTDILNLTAENFPLLSLSTTEFLIRTHGFVKPPLCCKKKDSVESVILKFLCFRVHRVYIINDDFKPIGVITLTDIMRYLLAPEDKDLVSPSQFSPSNVFTSP
jgi:CBS domain-containing protein